MLGVRRRLGLRSRTGLVRHMRRGPVLVGRSRLVQEVRRRSDGTCSDGKGTECAVVTSARRHLRRLQSNLNVMLIGTIDPLPAPTSAPTGKPSAAPTVPIAPSPSKKRVPSNLATDWRHYEQSKINVLAACKTLASQTKLQHHHNLRRSSVSPADRFFLRDVRDSVLVQNRATLRLAKPTAALRRTR